MAEESGSGLSRCGCGDIITSRGQKMGLRSPNKYGTDAVNGFIIVGQTMSALSRLPQMTPRDITIHKRHRTGGKQEIISFMAINSVRHSVEKLLMKGSRSATTTNSGDDTNQDIARDKLRCYSLDMRMLETVSNDIPRRKWSDDEILMPTVTTIEPQPTPFDDSGPESGATTETGNNALILKKPVNSALQSTDEILREYKEFVKRQEGFGEGRLIRSRSYNPSEYVHCKHENVKSKHENVQSKQATNFINVNLPRTSTADTEDKPKQQRQNISRINLLKHKDKALTPSGVSTGARNSSVERISSSRSRRGSSSMLLNRKSSRRLSRKFSLLEKSDTVLKNKKCQPPKPESPTPGPSEEEMLELQELPVIRKFLKMPESRPKVVCFDYPGVDLTHMDVKTAIEKVIPNAFETGKVVSMQFENVNVKLATGGHDNRWLIELKDFTTRNLLIKNGLAPECTDKSFLANFKTSTLRNSESPSNCADEEEKEEINFPQINYPKKVLVKLNDTVAMEEYKLYLRRTAAEEKLQNVILLCAGGGDKLLTNML